MKIITLTLNPAIDVHCNVRDFAPYHENLAKITSRDMGGKGINISRALVENGVDNSAFLVVGEENGEDFLKCLTLDGIPHRSISVSGRIRENFTVHTNNAPETRISFEGFEADPSLLDRILSDLTSFIEKDTVITLTGRLPKGICAGDAICFLEKVKKMGARVVIDSRSFNLSELILSMPWLIKPNEEEISEYLSRKVDSFDSVLNSACELHEKGIENVMISLGEKGALLVCDEGKFAAVPKKIKVASTIGAGDSSIAGFIAGTKMGYSKAECLRLAVSYGSAACLTEGTRPPLREDVSKIFEETRIEAI